MPHFHDSERQKELKEQRRTDQREFRRDSLSLWRQGLQDVFHGGTPEEKTWTNHRDIKDVLTSLGLGTTKSDGSHIRAGYVFLHYTGDADLHGAALAGEEDCIELRTQPEPHELGRILRPERLTFRVPVGENENPILDWSYLWLELAPLERTGIYNDERREYFQKIQEERVCELRPGEYVNIRHWENGYYGRDENHEERPLPDTARLMVRALGGALLIVPKGGPYNLHVRRGKFDLPNPSQGLHAKLGEEQFAEFINALA